MRTAALKRKPPRLGRGNHRCRDQRTARSTHRGQPRAAAMTDYQQIFNAITRDPRYQRNLDWGEPRPGHPEERSAPTLPSLIATSTPCATSCRNPTTGGSRCSFTRTTLSKLRRRRVLPLGQLTVMLRSRARSSPNFATTTICCRCCSTTTSQSRSGVSLYRKASSIGGGSPRS